MRPMAGMFAIPKHVTRPQSIRSSLAPVNCDQLIQQIQAAIDAEGEATFATIAQLVAGAVSCGIISISQFAGGFRLHRANGDDIIIEDDPAPASTSNGNGSTTTSASPIGVTELLLVALLIFAVKR